MLNPIDKKVVESVVQERYTDFGVYRFIKKNFKALKFSFAIYLATILLFFLKLVDPTAFTNTMLLVIFFAYFGLTVAGAFDHALIGKKLREIQEIINFQTGIFVSIQDIGEVVDEVKSKK